MVEAFEREFAEFCDVAALRRRGERHRRAAVRPDRRGRQAGRHRRHRAEHLHRDRPRRSRRPARGRSSSTSTSAPTTWIRRSCAPTWRPSASATARPAAVVSKRTGGPVTAVVPVHLYGQMADMDPILELAARVRPHRHRGRLPGARRRVLLEERGPLAQGRVDGPAAAFSFYPGKNLGACGEAGAVTTDDERMARRCRMLRDHGQSRKYFHDIEGYNGRLDAIQAGILRREASLIWRRGTSSAGSGRAAYDELSRRTRRVIVVPHVPALVAAGLPPLRRAGRGSGARPGGSRRAGIGTGIHYPVPLHLAKAYEDSGLPRR